MEYRRITEEAQKGSDIESETDNTLFPISIEHQLAQPTLSTPRKEQ